MHAPTLNWLRWTGGGARLGGGRGSAERTTCSVLAALLLLSMLGCGPAPVAATSVVVWGCSGDGCEIPNATKAALEAAPGIARLRVLWRALALFAGELAP